jgi:hypothetical protein
MTVYKKKKKKKKRKEINDWMDNSRNLVSTRINVFSKKKKKGSMTSWMKPN